MGFIPYDPPRLKPESLRKNPLLSAPLPDVDTRPYPSSQAQRRTTEAPIYQLEPENLKYCQYSSF